MNQSFLSTISLLVIFIAGIGCHRNEIPALLTFDAGAKFLDPNSVQDWNVKHVFTIKNNTGEEIHFENVLLSCGCAKCEMSTKTLQPGMSVDISMVVNLRYMREKRAEYATINWSKTTSESSETNDLRLVIECDVFPRVVAALSTNELIIDFNKPQPETIDLEFVAYCPKEEKKNLEIENLGSASQSTGLEFDPALQVDMLADEIVRLKKRLVFSPNACQNEKTTSEILIAARSGGSQLEFPIKLIHRELVKIVPTSVLLSPKIRVQKIRLATIADSRPPIVEFDKKLVSIVSARNSDQREFEYEVSLLGESIDESVESEIIFSFEGLAPVKCGVYVLKSQN